MASSKRYLNVSVASDDAVKGRFQGAMRGEDQGEWLTFPSAEMLWSVLSPERWAILQFMIETDGSNTETIARFQGRKIEDVEDDLSVLRDAGLISGNGNTFRFDYDGVHVDFVLAAA
ncbi:hypothetical protein [Fulvimarina sp. MAC8]|uniref:HVO_A0114 family putative DNA-binding protein n=1 Tax=Fulvimarina sp. MAC8 TaxID=3162874 RepID=UPI0032ECF391